MDQTARAPRILQYTYGGAQLSGIDSYLLETYRALDTSVLQFDLLFRYDVPFTAEQLRELHAKGARIASLRISETFNPLLKQGLEAARLWRFFSRNRYDAIEINMTSTFMCIQATFIAMLFGTKVRIVHAHDAASTESPWKKRLKALASPLLRALATSRWACAPEAAEYLFGEQTITSRSWTLVNNSIDVDRFVFQAATRDRMRKELGLSGELAVGLVGRLNPQKNPEFALVVFKDLLRGQPDAHLFVVGDGPLRTKLERLSNSLGIARSVHFLGRRHDVEQLFQAFDVILAPSLHEGFPIIAIEAQASGAPMVVSHAFPPSSEIIPGILTRLGLNIDAEGWASALRSARPVTERRHAAEQVRAAGYDRVDAVAGLLNAYADAGAIAPATPQ